MPIKSKNDAAQARLNSPSDHDQARILRQGSGGRNRDLCATAAATAEDQSIKVFWFFLSKKNCFLTFMTEKPSPPPGHAEQRPPHPEGLRALRQK
jgi:hypothetical protein